MITSWAGLWRVVAPISAPIESPDAIVAIAGRKNDEGEMTGSIWYLFPAYVWVNNRLAIGKKETEIFFRDFPVIVRGSSSPSVFPDLFMTISRDFTCHSCFQLLNFLWLIDQFPPFKASSRHLPVDLWPDENDTVAFSEPENVRLHVQLALR